MPNSLLIVSALASAPTTLLDLNDSATLYLDEFDAPPPPLRRSVSPSLAADGGLVTAAAYDDRTIRMSWVLKDTADNTASKLQALTRLLNQESCWLRWLPTGQTSPVFFKTKRSAISSITETYSPQGIRMAEVEILAEPFGIGLPVDSAVIPIRHDPSSGTNREIFSWAAGTILGDVPTPMVLMVDLDSVDSYGPAQFFSTALNGVTQGLQARNLAQLTAGTDTAAAVTGAGTVYVDGDYRACSFATVKTLVSRLSGKFTTPLAPLPGRYRAFVRYSIPSGAGASYLSFQLGLGEAAGSFSTYGEVKSLLSNNGSSPVIVDLGLYTLPASSPTQGIGYGADPTTSIETSVDLRIASDPALGTVATIRLDEIYFVPVDVAGQVKSTAMTTDFYAGASVADVVQVFDGVNDDVYVVKDTSGFVTPLSSSSSPIAAPARSKQGFIPCLVPGANVTNYLTVIHAPAVTTDETQIAIRYWPLYLYARPATT